MMWTVLRITIDLTNILIKSILVSTVNYRISWNNRFLVSYYSAMNTDFGFELWAAHRMAPCILS